MHVYWAELYVYFARRLGNSSRRAQRLVDRFKMSLGVADAKGFYHPFGAGLP